MPNFLDEPTMELIRSRMKAIASDHPERFCNTRNGEPSSTCWCYRTGPGGLTVACPPKLSPEVVAEVVETEFHLPDQTPVPWSPGR